MNKDELLRAFIKQSGNSNLNQQKHNQNVTAGSDSNAPPTKGSSSSRNYTQKATKDSLTGIDSGNNQAGHAGASNSLGGIPQRGQDGSLILPKSNGASGSAKTF